MSALNTADRDRLHAEIPDVALGEGQYLARRWKCINSMCSGYRYDDELVPGVTPRCPAMSVSGNGAHVTYRECNSVMANDGVYVMVDADHGRKQLEDEGDGRGEVEARPMDSVGAGDAGGVRTPGVEGTAA